MYVEIGGIEQWIEIGTESSDNPTLLFLHGGPGGSSRPAADAWKPWEKYFAVVHWDQRGAGLTFGKNGAAGCGRLTIDRMTNDAIEVVEFLRRHLNTSRIVVAGHSWGSVLGITMLRRRPDMFAAYVGTGQLVNKELNEELNYQRQLTQARAAQDADAVAALLGIGPPPFDFEEMKILRQWADKLASGAGDDVQMRPSPLRHDMTAADREVIMQGHLYSRAQLFDELSTVDLRALGLTFHNPIFFFHGTADQQTSIELVEQYFADITAPTKELIRFEGCHHFVVLNRPNDILSELLGRVHPVAVAAR
jgi:pimeloyl-ACP methyl ester carboxylesterase